MNTQILDRVSKLLKTKHPQNVFNLLVTLQKEQAPWLTHQEAVDCTIFSMVRLYNDYKLSYLWHEEQGHRMENSYSKVA